MADFDTSLTFLTKHQLDEYITGYATEARFIMKDDCKSYFSDMAYKNFLILHSRVSAIVGTFGAPLDPSIDARELDVHFRLDIILTRHCQCSYFHLGVQPYHTIML